MRWVKVHVVGQPFRVIRGRLRILRSCADQRDLVDLDRDDIIGPLQSLVDVCEDLGLPVSAKQSRRVRDVVSKNFADIPSLDEDVYQGALDGVEHSVRDLELVVEDELSLKAHLELTSEQTALYEIVNPFGEAVASAFPSTAQDIEEAAKCLALDRATASVFHLMRAVEEGLRALGKSLNDPQMDPTKNPSWEAILRKCRKQLALPIAERCDEWRPDNEFYSEATANLTAVKNAWRNTTLHPGKSYDPERANEVFFAVKAFMRHLATKLSE